MPQAHLVRKFLAVNACAAILDVTGCRRRTKKTDSHDSCRLRLVVITRHSVPSRVVQPAAQRSVDEDTRMMSKVR